MLTRSFYSRVIMSETSGTSGEMVPSELEWDKADPLYVTLTFLDPSGWKIVWGIGRDLLSEIVDTVSSTPACTGKGDVKGYCPTDMRVILCLTSPDGHSHISMPRGLVLSFLQQSYRKVPPTAEGAVIDEALTEFLKGLPPTIEEYEERPLRTVEEDESE